MKRADRQRTPGAWFFRRRHGRTDPHAPRGRAGSPAAGAHRCGRRRAATDQREHAARDRLDHEMDPRGLDRPRGPGGSPRRVAPARVVERAKRRVRVSPVSPVRACVQTCPRQNTRVVACRKSGAETRLDSQRIDEVSRSFPTSRLLVSRLEKTWSLFRIAGHVACMSPGGQL